MPTEYHPCCSISMKKNPNFLNVRVALLHSKAFTINTHQITDCNYKTN